MTNVKVDIWSDIACPWCFIGKRRFEEGVKRYRDAGGTADIDVEYHSFELAPDTPVDFDGNEIDFLAKHKGMPKDRVRDMLKQVTEVAASVGLSYDFDALKHTNTLKAHRVLHLARKHGRQLELMERLFAAYFEEGRHLGRDDELAVLAAEVGLDGDEVREALAGDAYAQDVVDDIAKAREYGITGVPFFVVNEAYGVSGAQEAAIFEQVLTEVTKEEA
ncbi:MAG TPA: DsbA family oxidoreductase [Candidatus Stackebrandtia excrementipullorum]|nr:DsbA family oxidoreductase [Candidatus Stackebrandtia excrementipullorum]